MSTLTAPVAVFGSGSDETGAGYHSFRIPAVLRAGGQLLAFAEGRRGSADDATVTDTVLRRSGDDGRTWGPLVVVSGEPGHTVGNPTPVVDPASGDVVLLTVRNPAHSPGTDEDTILRNRCARSVWVQRSRDDGATWSAPVDITADVKPEGWAWYATGPCHAIALTHGPHAGRLVVPANHSVLPGAGEPAVDAELDAPVLHGAHALLSDDGGRSWRLGYVDRNAGHRVNADESTVAELPDGTLHVSTRNHRGEGTSRAAAWSTDGGESLTAPFAELPDVTAPGIQGSLLTLPDGRLLLSTPTHPTRRRRLTVLVSRDGGRSWAPGLQVPAERAGYSDLVLLDDARVGLLHEGGTDSSFQHLLFTTFSVGELLP